jgi:hypothetical protein
MSRRILGAVPAAPCWSISHRLYGTFHNICFFIILLLLCDNRDAQIFGICFCLPFPLSSLILFLFLSFSLLPSFLFPSLLSLSASKGLSSPVPLSHSHSSHTRSVPIYHYTSGLEGSPRSTRLELRGAFDALYAYLSDELSTSSAGKGQLHI